MIPTGRLWALLCLLAVPMMLLPAVLGGMSLPSRGGVAEALALATAFAFARTLPLALLLLPVVGATLLLTTSSCNTILQTILPEELRGRVMALYSTAFLGTAPLGSLLAGALASRIGTTWTIAACGVET